MDRAFVDEFPEATYVALGVDGTTGLEPGSHLATAGLEIERDVVLSSRGLRRPPPPSQGDHVRELRSGDDWDQVLDLRSVSRDDGPLPTEHGLFLERSTDEARALVAVRDGAYFGAFSDDRLSRWSALSDSRLWPASRTWPPEPTTVDGFWPEAWWYERGSSASRSWGRRLW